MINSKQDTSQGRGMFNLTAWGFGILFIFCGVVDMAENFIQGLLFTLIGLVILPKSWRFIEKKTKIKNGWIIRIIIFVVLVVLFGLSSGK